MAKLFVSYSRRDSVTARKLIEALNKMGEEVWVDWASIPPAADWLDQILHGIEGSDAFIFLISPDSIASEVCNVEIKHAALNNKRIIPVVLKDVDPKSTIEIIAKLNWTYMRKGDQFDEGIAKIKTAIELDLEWVEEHNRLQSRALEWHRKKDPSLLLRGRQLRNARRLVMTAGKKDPTPTNLQQMYIHYSNRDDRRRTLVWSATIIVVLVMAFLSYVAVTQRDKANLNADLANKNQQIAEDNAKLAKDNEIKARSAQQQAEEAQVLAEKSENSAKAKRSTAKAQIFQSQTGGLYTSTLFAIDSWQREQSPEAEEILRKNISLLPIPVAQLSQSKRINAVEFSPDGKTFVSASEDGTACVWNVEGGKKLFCATSPKPVTDAVFSPDSSLLVTSDESGKVNILNAQNGNLIKEFAYGVPVRDVNIHPNGRLLAAARDDGTITIIDLKALKETNNLQTFGRLNISTFSPDGQWLAAGSSSGSVTIWRLDEVRIIAAPSHRGGVLTIAFSPNSKTIISGGSDSLAIVAETATGRKLLQIPNEDWVTSLAFSPDGAWFVTVSDDQRIRVWDTASGREKLRMLQDSFITRVKVSSDGQWIATTGFDKTVRVWSAATGAELFQIPLGGNGSVLAFSNDGKYLVSGDDTGAVDIWDISVMPKPKNYLQFKGFTGNILFSPSGDWLAASDENRVWLLTPSPAGQFSKLRLRQQDKPTLELSKNIKSLIVSPDSKWLGISTISNDILIYNIRQKISKVVNPSGSDLSIAFSSDSALFYTAGSEGIIQAWNVATGTLANTYSEKDISVNSLAVSPTHIAVGVKDKIVILNVSDGKKVIELQASGDHPLLAFNREDTLLASVNSSGQVQVWKYSNNGFNELWSISREQAFSLSFSPDGKQLAVGTKDNIYLVDPISGNENIRIPHTGSVNGMTFSMDGTIFASTSFRSIQIWEVASLPGVGTTDLIETACSRMVRNFSAAEWSFYFDPEAYKRLCQNLPGP